MRPRRARLGRRPRVEAAAEASGALAAKPRPRLRALADRPRRGLRALAAKPRRGLCALAVRPRRLRALDGALERIGRAQQACGGVDLDQVDENALVDLEGAESRGEGGLDVQGAGRVGC